MLDGFIWGSVERLNVCFCLGQFITTTLALVTEVKGLSSILVGMVTCKSADFFMARPQLMVVDITELGTIKLQLEVVWKLAWSDPEWQRVIFSDESRFSLGGDAQRIRVWRHRGQHRDGRFVVTRPEGLVSLHLHPYRAISRNCVRMFKLHGMDYHRAPLGTSTAPYRDVWPDAILRDRLLPFDSGEVKPITSSASRQSVHSRKGSMYSWTPPNTPSFTEKYFLSMMRQLQDPDGSFSIGSRESRGVSLLSYLSDSAQALTPPAYERAGRPPITLEPSVDTQSVDDDLLKAPLGEGDESGEWPSEPETSTPSPRGSKRESIFLFQRYSTPDILRQNGEVATNQEVEAEETAAPDEVRVEEPSAEQEVKEKPQVQAGVVGISQRKAAAVRVSLALAELDATLQEMSFAEDELKRLDLQTQQFSQVLKRDIFPLQTSSSETLAVEEEEVLGSFDFLSTDFSADDISCMGSVRLRDTREGLPKENTVKSRGVMAQDTARGQETRQGPQTVESEDRSPLSTGDYTLDQALEIHLTICTALLRALRLSDSEHVRQDILEELSRQTEVLEKIEALTHKKTDDISATEREGLTVMCGAPKLRNVQLFWEECCESDSSFCCAADSFLRTLRKRFIHKVKAKLPGQADTVFGQLLQQVQSSCRMVPVAWCVTDRVSMFQLQVYLDRWKLTDFGEHISHLSREVYLVSCLEGPKRRRALKKLRGRRISELQPTGRTLQLLAKLLTDANHKVAATASSCLCRASGFKSFRSKAVVHYTWLLRENDTQLQQEACLALKCLKATESAEQVAELWRSGDEDLRNAARETVLSFGKKGHVAFQRMDRICSELQEEIYKNLDTEITIF
ncbi:hypothetical protein NFI96_021972 [Prochilodus magdalenae]|nr:hypothetical protein NFI96_021972 [Prochilodus magdalenae]